MVVSAAFAVVSVAVNLYGGVITEQKRAELQLEVGGAGRPGGRQLGGAGRRGGGGPAERQGSAGWACVALGIELKGAQYERSGQRPRSGGPGNASLVVHAKVVPCRSNPCGDHLLLLHALMPVRCAQLCPGPIIAQLPAPLAAAGAGQAVSEAAPGGAKHDRTVGKGWPRRASMQLHPPGMAFSGPCGCASKCISVFALVALLAAA